MEGNWRPQSLKNGQSVTLSFTFEKWARIRPDKMDALEIYNWVTYVVNGATSKLGLVTALVMVLVGLIRAGKELAALLAPKKALA